MGTLVKIIRSSIKKNPIAGRTYTNLQGAREISFEITGEIPKYLKDEENCVITSWREDTKWCEGLLFNDDLIEKLLSEKDLKITINRKNNIETIHHAPNPQYLYSYEKSLIECDNCHSKINLSDIKEEYSDEGYSYLLCPVCKEVDTFEIKYEKIEDVIKSVNLDA